MSPTPIIRGTQVTYQGIPYTVRSVDGNVLTLESDDGYFCRFAHVSSVIVCPPPAAAPAVDSLPAPAAAVQGAGIPINGQSGLLLQRLQRDDANRAAWMAPDLVLVQYFRKYASAERLRSMFFESLQGSNADALLDGVVSLVGDAWCWAAIVQRSGLILYAWEGTTYPLEVAA